MPQNFKNFFVDESKPRKFTNYFVDESNREDPEKFSLWNETKNIADRIVNEAGPPLSRLMFGPSEEEHRKNVYKLNPKIAAEIEAKGGKFSPVGMPSEKSLLPKFKQPTSYTGGFLNSLYEDYIRPLASEAGVLGQSFPAHAPFPWGEGVELGPVHGPTARPPFNPERALPPAPTQRTFFQGPYGTTELGKTYPMDVGSQRPTMAGQLNLPLEEQAAKGRKPFFEPGSPEQGTLKPSELGEISQIPALQAAGQGTTLGQIPELNINAPMDEIRGQLERASQGPISLAQLPTKKPPYNVGNIGPVELPSAPVKPSRLKLKTEAPAQAQPTVAGTTVAAPKIVTELRPIPKETNFKDAVLQFFNGSSGARFAGQRVKKQFADLADPELIYKYQQGDRSGRLKDVENYFENRWQQNKEVGLLQPDQKKLNYLRQYWTQPEEEQSEAVRRWIAKNPQYAKESKFPTYKVGEEAGLTRKYQTIPEIMGAYEKEFQEALRKKEFFDYLKQSGQLAKGTISTHPTEWEIKGPNAKDWKYWSGNFFGESARPAKALGAVGQYTKNLYLGSGIPKTPLNMHYYNTMKSDFYAQGMKGVQEYLSNTFSPEKDIKYLESKGEFIKDLIDRGFQHSIEGHATLLDEASSEGGSKLVNLFKKAQDLQTKTFEDPLFKIHLPAKKVKLAENIYNDAIKQGLDKESALRQAATISNDFMGGVNKVLRNKTLKDLAQFGLVAPDWLESRYNLAVKGFKALAGKEHPIYAKALGRKASLLGVEALGNLASQGSVTNPSRRSTNITDISLGKTAGGYNREFPMFGTTAEEIRIPAELMAAYNSPTESVGERLSTLAKGRLSTPLRAGMGLAFNMDPFGKPLYGHTQYGAPMKPSTQLKNIAGTAISPFVPPYIQSAGQILEGGDIERAIMQALEIPLQYNKEPRPRLRVTVAK